MSRRLVRPSGRSMPRRNAWSRLPDPVRAAAEAQRVADEPPQDGRDAHRDEALDHDRQRVLAADEPAVEEGEPRRHEHHQARGEEHEAGVRAVDHRAIVRLAHLLTRPDPATVRGYAASKPGNCASGSRALAFPGFCETVRTMDLDGAYVWVTSRKLKPGSREEFSRSWRPSEFPEGMIRAYELALARRERGGRRVGLGLERGT